jgi:Ni,Fe-hydrogenase III large subunit
MSAAPLTIRNCEPVPTASIPLHDAAEFYALLRNELDAHGRTVAYFGYRHGDEVRLIAVIAQPAYGRLAVFSCTASHEMVSLAQEFPQLQLFEREIAEQFGVSFSGHPWFKPVRFHAPITPASDLFSRPIGAADFYSMEGEEIHEVAVGPVHAGVIEPGHFRFQCHGENVYHLEISLGYQHRGIEQMVTGTTVAARQCMRFMMETCAGDTTAGHTIAYAQLMEALSGCAVPPRAHALRAIALELERCANHIGDLGALAGDVGYLPTASYCGRIRGDTLNATALLCGSRFGRSFIGEGGVLFDLDEKRRNDLLRSVATLRKDFTNAADLLWDEPSVLARFEETGIVSKEACETWGIVGPASRASGCMHDVRQDFPFGLYQFAHIPVVTHDQGDVFARASVRYGEVLRSLTFIEEQASSLAHGDIIAHTGQTKENNLVVSLTEGWRGEICHTAITDDRGDFVRYKIVDPSFHNWSALALALRGQQISDFPLCNKSFNLSYCGYDL